MKTSVRFAIHILVTLAVALVLPPAQAQTLTVLHSFGATANDGTQPQSALLVDSAGNIYGTTYFGGQYGSGTVFKLTPNGTETLLHTFQDYSDGTGDGIGIEGLAVGPDGNFYGASYYGGLYNRGTIFQITPGGVLTTLYNFGAVDLDGYGPSGSLVVGSDGSVYGTTYEGGQYNNDPNNNEFGDGTVFQIKAKAETILHSFGATATDGATPDGLFVGTDGNYYSTTTGGGQHGDGTIVKVTPGGVVTNPLSFSTTAADLIMGTDGSFYGTTYSGGQYGYGSVVKITPSGTQTVLHSFNYAYGDGKEDGLYPEAALVQGADGNFYGTTAAGGRYGNGIVFRITPAGVLTVLHTFNSFDATFASAPLVFGPDGDLYGTTYQGGAYGYANGGDGDGTAFKMALTGVAQFALSAPATAQAGTPFSVTVTAQDIAGNTISGYSGTVHFLATDGAALLPANAKLTNGVGTFSVTLKTAGAQYLGTLDAVNSGLFGETNAITVSAVPAKIAFAQQPTAAVAGAALAPAPTIKVTDSGGNPVTGSAVTLSLASGTGALGGTLTQTTDATGTATFSDLSVSRPGAKTLKATVGSLAVTSSSFSVSADDKLTAAGVAVSAVKRVSFKGSVATFTDTDKTSPATDFTASLTWGDGTAATAGTVSGSSGAFTVAGTHTYATEGTYTVTITLTDTQPGGPKASTTAKATVKDTTAPTTTAKLSPAAPNGLNSFYKSAVTVTLSATDPDNTVSEITTSYSVDGATTKTYTAPFTVATDGTHTITYHSTDKAGNAETAKTLTFKIDATAPVTTATAAKVAAGEQVTLKATDTLSGVSSTVYSLDGAAAKTYTAPFTISVNGSHTVTFHSTDKAGNIEATKTLKLTVTVALPSTTATLSGTLGTNGYYTGAVTVSLKTTAGGLAVAKRDYRLDGGASAAYTAPLSVSGDKTHTVTFYAVDSAGNAETPKTVTFKIDATKPVTTATTKAVTGGEQITLSATDDFSGVATTVYSIDGAAAKTYTAPFTVAGTGKHTVMFHSTDKAGNMEAAKIVTFTNP